LDLSLQTQQVASQFSEELQLLLKQQRFVGGHPIEEFETQFAAFCGVHHCVALNSGSDALRLGLLAAGVKPDDEVISTPFTFIATAEAISQTANLILADIDPNTFTLSAEAVTEKLSPRSRAIVPVHIFGLPADMKNLETLCTKQDLLVIEDACQAHGASIDGRRVGSFGTAAAFSFYPSKNLGAFGDAGAITCQTDAVAERVRLLRNHGQIRPYRHQFKGFNSRMDTIQSLVLRLKLPLLEKWNERRRRLAEIYRTELDEVEEIRFQKVPEGYQHVFHIVALLAERRSELMQFLRAKGIETRVIYPVPLHLDAAYGYLGYKKGDFPNAEVICEKVVCLPVYPGLSDRQAHEIALSIRAFYDRKS
jgi:dTDP-4-amino-4,6-dideoxygalactose transaminase